MRPILPAVRSLAVAGALGLTSAPAAFDLMNWGTSSFEVDAGSTAAYTQDASSVIFKGAYGLGDNTLFGPFLAGAQDWSLYSTFRLRMTLLSGPNPSLPFSLEFFSPGEKPNDFDIVAQFQGNTSGLLTNQPSLLELTLSATGPGTFAAVAGMQFTWDGQDSIHVAVSEVVGYEKEGAHGFFTASAPGGFRFMVGANGQNPEARLLPGESAWSYPSDRHLKTTVTAIDPQDVLRKVSALPVTTWQYTHDPDRRYIGPMAQDFHGAFGLGRDNKHISTLDADGVALSALKGLITELQERKERSAAQAKRLAELEAELRALREKVQSNLLPAE